MTNYRKVQHGPFAATLSMGHASASLAWAIAVNCAAPTAQLHVRWLTGAATASAIEPLEPEEIVLWLATVFPSPHVAAGEHDTLSIEQAAKVLDAEETDRMARFLHIEDRMSYLAAHAGARLLLGRLIDQPADALRFEPSAHGKPALVGGPANLDFSLSHARGAVAVAAAGMPIGVDIEPLREIADMDSISEIVLAAEERKVLRNAPVALRPRLFLRYWTLKEAVLKAASVGFTIPPNTVTIDAGASPAVLAVPDALGSAAEWRLIAPAV
ncbi:4'-phosphopantetheinyl transferase superfamily protein [Bradyrhizobium sp. CSA112]|uniref:4'-phosphopantetheinyl transferase family protein n=1 Tax=Bradyrhizobium sp. CSA112 TaxID=2699170 RepID=UPI0023AF7769|nr:4'-phosphopantetheinyl transferase superfamily protein [Bradyrhizobium sp. CSA112]MDE5457031.1 4'-phosphopantetheinyl transferase superfamily protein [Bradyrhizobium sp. CSA112]